MSGTRAYSVLTIRAVDEERRELVGIATTPSTDRYGDVVEPQGALFTLPLPFLWQHDQAAPIGHVTKARTTRDGIEVTVKVAKSDEPGTLKQRLDEAWQSIKSGLVRGLSIGFKPIEYSYIEGAAGGIRYIAWDWLELSAVTIPANAEATITAVRAADQSQRFRAAAPPSRKGPPPSLWKEDDDPAVNYDRFAAAFAEADQARDPERMLAIVERAMQDHVIHGFAANRISRDVPDEKATLRTVAITAFLASAQAYVGIDLAYRLSRIQRVRRELLEDRVAALEQRLAAVESRKGFAYRGIWDASDTYEPDDFVTHSGSMWHTDEATQSRPGSPGSPWQLCVKRGRDAAK